MIGIQGENGLEEVTKSPPDTSLDASSTNAVENRVVTQAINDIKNKTLIASGSLSAKNDAYNFPSNMTVLVYRIVKTGYYSSQSLFMYPNLFDGAYGRCVDFDNIKITFSLNNTSISLPNALASGYAIEYRAYK